MRRRRGVQGALIMALAGVTLGMAPPLRAATVAPDLTRLSLEELSSIEVSSVSRRSERLSQVAASLYVISREDLRRAGVRTLPEALRLAPNLQVARVNANQYAISARGFNNAIGNKLLVLIDGRTVYAPYFSGVQWDQQDVLLDDVARIEVISGPGGTVWGTNAVNGVVNIITRPAAESQGWMARAGGGDGDALAALRHGGVLPGDGRWRAYVKLSRQQNTDSEAGTPVADGAGRQLFGWRADWLHDGDGFTLQGDSYRGGADERASFGRIRSSGTNMLARWTGALAGGSRLRLQGYYDHSEREDRLTYSPTYTVLDLEAQHSLALGEHRIDWGAGWRRSRDRVGPGLFVGFVPERDSQQWINFFVQDEFALAEGLRLTAGIKLERNDFTGWETLPTLRLAWAASPQHFWWASLSRAVRAPSRLDRDIRIPARPPYLIVGGPDFVSEVARVAELGYRAQPSSELNFALTLFHHDWDRLRSGQRPPNAQVQNMIAGRTSGLEGWARWQPQPWLRLNAGLTVLNHHLAVKPGSADPVGPSALGNDPRRQWQLRATWLLPYGQDLELGLRRVDALPNPAVPAYTALDLSYSRRLGAGLDVMLGGQNLLDRRHPEINAAPGRSVFPRSFFLQLRWSQ